MGKTSFLKFNGVDTGNRDTQDTMVNVMQQSLNLELEHSCHQISSVCSSLPSKNLLLDFRPVGVSCHSDEEISTTIEPVDSQGILAALHHVVFSTCERGG